MKARKNDSVITRSAVAKDIPRLEELWQICFGDEQAYIDLFFKDLFRAENYVLLEISAESGAKNDKTVVSGCFLLPCTLILGSSRHNISYLYALCTNPDFRNRGFASALLDFAADYCKKRGDDGIALVPAEDGLFSFYDNKGYKRAFNGVRQSENYICYTNDILRHVKNAEGFFDTKIPDEHGLIGLLCRLNDNIKDFDTAYMAYPLD